MVNIKENIMKKDHGIPIVYSDHSSRDISESFNARQTDREGAFLSAAFFGFC